MAEENSAQCVVDLINKIYKTSQDENRAISDNNTDMFNAYTKIDLKQMMDLFEKRFEIEEKYQKIRNKAKFKLIKHVASVLKEKYSEENAIEHLNNIRIKMSRCSYEHNQSLYDLRQKGFSTDLSGCTLSDEKFEDAFSNALEYDRVAAEVKQLMSKILHKELYDIFRLFEIAKKFDSE